MTESDLVALRSAVWSLEHPGLAARLTNMVGKPIELIGDALPTSARRVIVTATSKALQAALKVALRTMPWTDHAGSGLLHKALATHLVPPVVPSVWLRFPLNFLSRRSSCCDPSRRSPEATAKILSTRNRDF